ncbi:hypothetical protein MNBD_GAMMA23-897 [hydrothermal vent metagenome]|uniref:DUF4124 domain-containing protein n=1 Tax=hydrothermal vent metagenome TaxID=652676 RepID=A0A3B0ZSA5_9ZZZZ
MKFKTLAALVLLLSPISAFSGMYKYQDKSGTWVYSQQPPATGEYETIRGPKETRSSKLPKEARDEKLKKARKAVLGDPVDKAAKDKVAKETAKNADKRTKSCEQSKKALETLQVYRRFIDKDGNATVMDSDVRAKGIKNAMENIKQFCD